MTNEQMYEMTRIIEKYIPLGNDTSLCHVGICSIKRCSRCMDAYVIRDLLIQIRADNKK